MLTITPKQAPPLLIRALKHGLVPYLTGSPGLGKSQLIRDIAKENNLKVIDLRLSQMDISDLLGLPYFIENNTRCDFVPPKYFPLEGDPIPDGYKGWLILFDELAQAPPAIQNASFKILLDRMVGQHPIHPKVAMIAAGNKATDKAHVFKMGTALQSRLVHLELEVNSKDWLEWASSNGIDFRIMAYIGFKPTALFSFKPDHNDCTFSCPRSWHFLSKIIKEDASISPNLLPLITGTISEGVGREFYAFLSIFDKLPTMASILANPESTNIGEEPSVKFALSSLVSENMSVNNIGSLMTFVNRFPKEFQIITLQVGLKKNIALLQTEPIKDWIKINSLELFD